ncbi:hypothetical protein FACS1894187_17180 [Synergistales bacterium]|nr:hypothetical protein FACS1894187_17180 [Synergistales bacterium]
MPARDKPRESQKHVESLMKGLEVLDSLQGRPEMSLTEIADALGIYKSRAMMLCGTLEHMGYVVYDGRERVFRLGPRVPGLARVYENTNPLLALVRPALERLGGMLWINTSPSSAHHNDKRSPFERSSKNARALDTRPRARNAKLE